jgi:TIGR02436 family protein
MKNILDDKSFAFAVRVVKMARYLETEKREYILSKQILRSSTAIGVLINEAVFAQSKADFISKLSISLKEANETSYWLKLLKETEYIEDALYKSLYKDVTEILALLVSSIKTAKEKLLRETNNKK